MYFFREGPRKVILESIAPQYFKTANGNPLKHKNITCCRKPA